MSPLAMAILIRQAYPGDTGEPTGLLTTVREALLQAGLRRRTHMSMHTATAGECRQAPVMPTPSWNPHPLWQTI
jgi:hypothetical protein